MLLEWLYGPKIDEILDDHLVQSWKMYRKLLKKQLCAQKVFFAINSFLQALKKPIWTLLIGIYRQAFGVAFFSYIFVYIWGFGVIGVWFGIATSVLSGLILSLILAHHAAKPLIGGIFTSKHMAEKTG